MGYFSYQYLVKINTFFFFFSKIDREGWIITPRSNICSRYRRYWCPIFIVFLEPDGSRQAGSSCWKPGGSFSFFWFLLLSAGVRRTLRDSKTKSERLPGTSRTTQEKAGGSRGAGGGWGGGWVRVTSPSRWSRSTAASFSFRLDTSVSSSSFWVSRAERFSSS